MRIYNLFTNISGVYLCIIEGSLISRPKINNFLIESRCPVSADFHVAYLFIIFNIVNLIFNYFPIQISIPH
jgi:hypothetical protein